MSVMTSLAKAFPLRQLAWSKPAVIYNVTRQYADLMLEDVVPGPYPKTKKEREAAAKKYGLLPHEYEVFPDDGLGKGDYPNLPDISGDSRDPHYPWDYPVHRRNFNDTWHAYTDLMHMDRIDVNEKYPMPPWKMFFLHFAAVGAMLGCFLIGDNYKHGSPVLKKHFFHNLSKDGPHYSFEPAE